MRFAQIEKYNFHSIIFHAFKSGIKYFIFIHYVNSKNFAERWGACMINKYTHFVMTALLVNL